MSKLRLVLFLLNAFLAWGMWISEIIYIKGWSGLAWLESFNWSVVPICLLLAISTTFAIGKRASPVRYVAYIVVIEAAAIAAFSLMRHLAFELYSNGVYFGPRLPVLAFFFAAWFLVPIAHTVAATLLLRSQNIWPALLGAIALLISVPLSFVTIRIFPAVNGSVDQIHAFKMGYPIFWMVALFPVAVMLGQKRHAVTAARRGQVS